MAHGHPFWFVEKRIAPFSRDPKYGELYQNQNECCFAALFPCPAQPECKHPVRADHKKSRTVVLLVLVLVAGEGFEPPTSGL